MYAGIGVVLYLNKQIPVGTNPTNEYIISIYRSRYVLSALYMDRSKITCFYTCDKDDLNIVYMLRICVLPVDVVGFTGLEQWDR